MRPWRSHTKHNSHCDASMTGQDRKKVEIDTLIEDEERSDEKERKLWNSESSFSCFFITDFGNRT